jgi:hypothetical protein
MRYELNVHEWEFIKPMLPNKPRGIPRVDDRRNRFVRWRRAGVRDGIMEMPAARALCRGADEYYIHRPGAQLGSCVAENRERHMRPSRGRLTSKVHAVVDADGLPLRPGLTPREAPDHRPCLVLPARLRPRRMLLPDRG